VKTIGNESVLIQLAQCRFPGQAIPNAKILMHFSNKIYGRNIIKQHSEKWYGLKLPNADCSLRKKNIVSFIIIFGTLSFPIAHVCGRSAGTPATTNRCRRCRSAQTKIMNFSSLDGNRSILACSSIGGGGALCQQGRRQAGVYLLCTLVYKLFTVLTERSTAPP